MAGGNEAARLWVGSKKSWETLSEADKKYLSEQEKNGAWLVLKDVDQRRINQIYRENYFIGYGLRDIYSGQTSVEQGKVPRTFDKGNLKRPRSSRWKEVQDLLNKLDVEGAFERAVRGALGGSKATPAPSRRASCTPTCSAVRSWTISSSKWTSRMRTLRAWWRR